MTEEVSFWGAVFRSAVYYTENGLVLLLLVMSVVNYVKPFRVEVWALAGLSLAAVTCMKKVGLEWPIAEYINKVLGREG